MLNHPPHYIPDNNACMVHWGRGLIGVWRAVLFVGIEVKGVEDVVDCGAFFCFLMVYISTCTVMVRLGFLSRYMGLKVLKVEVQKVITNVFVSIR